MSTKSLEQRLFQAYQLGRGLKLSYDDVLMLIYDDAIATRITNVACLEADIAEIGIDCIQGLETWNEFKARLYANSL